MDKKIIASVLIWLAVTFISYPQIVRAFDESANFYTKCVIELIRIAGINITDNPTKDEIIRCKQELDKRHYKIQSERRNFGISNISLLYFDEFVVGYDLKAIYFEKDERVGYKIEANPVVER